MEDAAAQAARFYASPVGQMAAALLRERLGLAWPTARGQRLLGLGFAAPFLDLWKDAERAIPAMLGAAGPGCVVDPEALPFPDRMFDRILIVHGLEAADNPRRLLREAWRVLADGGQLLAVAPNRLSLWAQIESTPFGHGQPFSAGQLERLLTATMFKVEGRDAALFCPPLRSRLLRRGAWQWDRWGRRLLPALGGVTLTLARKQVLAALPPLVVEPQRLPVPLPA
jgi:SAM-dependent methyltransferase